MTQTTRPGTIRSILVIDDDVQFGMGIKTLLQKHRFLVQATNGGGPGLRILAQEPVDLVITDIFMEDTDGLEAIIAIRERHPGIRIIGVSGGSRGVRIDCLGMALGLGADRILRKPLWIETLLSSIRELEDESLTEVRELNALNGP
ncbi:MAG: response regulator [Pedosphaera sp.]|nr:response regulator [Pedosphaera sp.]